MGIEYLLNDMGIQTERTALCERACIAVEEQLNVGVSQRLRNGVQV